jgi:hypothetical protein
MQVNPSNERDQGLEIANWIGAMQHLGHCSAHSNDIGQRVDDNRRVHPRNSAGVAQGCLCLRNGGTILQLQEFQHSLHLWTHCWASVRTVGLWSSSIYFK